jgi:tetratricopeptide (TPR) repeat protein
MERKTIEELLSLARDIASGKTDEELDKAIEILLYAIGNGCDDPEVLVTAASLLLQGSRSADPDIKKKAIQMVDKSMALEPDMIPVLEQAIACYELTLNDFPDKLDNIVKLCFRILDINPDHIESMLILANQRNRPGVTLSLEDAIGMLEWAQEVEPENKFVTFTLARLYLESGRFAEAKTLFSHIISSSPGSKEADNAQREINSLRFTNKKSGKIRYRKYGRN